MIFFDIETTGFSPDSTYLYLIGCIYYKDESFHIIQWFSEDIREEVLILKNFFEFITNYDVLIHYNGTGFDIPYLERKCTIFHLDYSFDHILSLDIYKKITPYKKILKLDNYKQKTLEIFLKTARTDIFDGGDLIQVYAGYLGKKRYETLAQGKVPSYPGQAPTAKDLLQQLLLHNEDDIKGLLKISPILYYCDLFEKPFHKFSYTVEDNQLTLQLITEHNLPIEITYSNEYICFKAFQNTAVFQITLIHGVLKFFFDNYKDYYYLPKEDTAVHKSLAAFVEKEYRQKAKAATCYTKKEGVFLPQFESLFSPIFKQNHNDKITYFECTEDFLSNQELMISYINHLFRALQSGK
jgi:uncharacterized protein YprB with RNaseH-like and TPR domain